MLWLTLQALTASFVAVSLAVDNTRILKTTHGPVFTEDDGHDGVVAYKGITYAAPPVNDLRWRSPTPPEPWTTPLNTTSFGPACLIYITVGNTGPQSEDYLTMNVWTPASSSSDAFPVMVFIHGGGFEFDTATSPSYDGARLAEAGVVLVSFDYRLGNLGFLARPDLDAEDPAANSGNFGLQDQILALQWVRDNIAAFGGDPKNVLVFGESAGSHAIGLLMASPLGHGLFDKAIMESGAWWDSEHGSLATFEEARQRGVEWGERFGPDASLEQLRALPAGAVVNSSIWDFTLDPGVTAFSPSIDRHVLPMHPSHVFSAGAQVKVPLLAGWNLDEGYLFRSRALPSSTPEEFKSHLASFFDVEGRNQTGTEEKLALLYPASTTKQATSSAVQWTGDLIISEQTWEAAHLHSRSVRSTYVYHFTYTSPYSPAANHASELPFVFGNLLNSTGSSPTPSEEDRAFSDAVVGYWVNFAATGNPNNPATDLPHWPRYVPDCLSSGRNAPGKQLLLTLGTEVGVDKNFDYGRFDFLRSFRGDDGAFPVEWRKLEVE